MESKLQRVVISQQRRRLLIEPVWNRNDQQQFMISTPISQLLIEPVWNRNNYQASCQTNNNSLLIEPVWNRNKLRYEQQEVVVVTFNRTSMESKPLKRGGACRQHRAVTFNRTSMESKHRKTNSTTPNI